MDTTEIESLEEKTRSIVDALSKLECEAKRQKDMADSLAEGRDAIVGLASELRLVAERLAGVVDMVNESTLGEDVSHLSEIKSSCAGLQERADALADREEDVLKRLAALEDVIGRIDRNTQKGFFRERE